MDRVRPSFMTRDQLERYMSDAKGTRTPRPRPNFEIPTKRLSLTLAEQIGDLPTEEPKPEPLTRVQTDTVVPRRFGGSVRDVQRSKGTLRTKNGWIIGGAAERRPTWGAEKPATPQPTILEDSNNSLNIEKIKEQPIVTAEEHPIKEDEKENILQFEVDSPVEVNVSMEDSITKLQDDISQEIEAVSILLDSPIEEKDLSPTIEDVQDEADTPILEPNPESPAPLKITRTQPVDIKPSNKALHSSQMPEPAMPVTNNSKTQYSVNSPPTPSSTPPELEKRPKFEDRGVPTHAPVAPPTPPTKVMIMEDDKVVGEMSLEDSKGDMGYNVQQDNPNAVAVSSEVSKIASKISELQMKADPFKPAPKPALPSISMEEFQDRNQVALTQMKPDSPSGIAADPRFAFGRTNSMPPTLPSHTPPVSTSPTKAYERPQYKPYRPPVQPTQIPLRHPSQNIPGPWNGVQTFPHPQPTPPAPPMHPSQYSQAIPPHMQAAHGRHSSLSNIHQHGHQTPLPQPLAQNYGRNPMQWQAPQSHMLQNQVQPARHFQQGPPPVPTHAAQGRQMGQPAFSNGGFQRRSSIPPAQADSPQAAPAPPVRNRGYTGGGRTLPPLPMETYSQSPALPSVPKINFDQTQSAPKTPSPVTKVSPTQNQPSPPVPTFAFDDVSEPSARQLPAVPTQPTAVARAMFQIPSIAVDDANSKPAPKPPVPSFSFSDDSSPSQPSIPTISFPDDDTSKPSVPTISFPDDDDDSKSSIPTFSVSGPDERNDTRPLPTPVSQKQDSRPLPTPRGNSAHSFADRRAAFETHGHHGNSRVPIPRSVASCTACGNHISARAVSASGLRFHPECFRCSHCSTRLEHVAFYPEPLRPDAPEGTPHSGRFFCHLDYHELFSPRCKSCKTPIEGEVVEACGATWHSGHFFCAECGDPFDSQSRFVEKDKYAWCLGCYQKRYSSKCKKCKKPVMDTVVKALDADWHMECFCCFECGSEFQDGRYFLRDGCKNEPVCTKCEESRLKSWDLVQ